MRDVPLEPLPPPQPQPGQAKAALMGGLVGGAGVLAAFHFGREIFTAHLRESSLWLLGPGFIAVAFLAILAHELGHVIGGWLVRFRFMFLIVGPFRFDRTGSSLRLQLNRNLALAGGVALSLPDDDEDLARRYAVMVAGGPVFSGLLGLVAGIAVFVIERFDVSGMVASTLMLMLLIFAVISSLLAAVTLIPIYNGPMPNDGLRLLRFLKNDEPARRDSAMLQLIAASMLGRRPRELPTAVVRAALHPPDGSFSEFCARYFALIHCNDTAQFSEARVHRDRLLRLRSGAPGSLSASMLFECFRSHFLAGEAVSDLRPTLADIERFLSPPERTHLAAIKLLIAGQPEEAQQLLRQPDHLKTITDPYTADQNDALLARAAPAVSYPT